MMNDDQLRALRAAPPQRSEDPASEAQERYIAILVEDREVPPPWLQRIKDVKEAEVLTKPLASKIITALRSLPKKNQVPSPSFQGTREEPFPTHRDVPAGRYAIQTGATEEHLTFYRVKRPYKERPEVFYVCVIAGPQEIQKSYHDARRIVKDIYRAGAADAAVRYGHKVGRCFECHTRLTNRLSRRLGTGPICGGRLYSDWEERVDSARRQLIAEGFDPTENVRGEHE
jgi:hypothetical protein